MNIDMHVHTLFSDGDFSPREVVQMGKQKGLKVIAITDHDECRGFGEAMNETGITVIPGIELAARFEGEAHVLGLNIDWNSPAILEHIEGVSSLRRRRAQGMLGKLNEAGVSITYEDIEAESSGVLGRPHIAAALVKKGYASSVKEAFTKYLSKHTQYYVPYDKISVEEAAQLIIKAGGKAVLAHPGLIREEARTGLFPRLSGLGFWGVEAYHPSHTDGQCREFESVARGYGLFVTAGSDFHGSAKPGIELGAEKRGGEYLAESVRILTGISVQ